ncbi:MULTISPECIES: FeoB-associated Cys-rich membrane protein [unclassified Desulfovibrio]|uniref:FeoB-associated Cys-rich membrane protein n=1 Tax=unclassified Desulfovibrio TaxID=2593640 RepID=UPI000F5E5376|nr:MULTISPECIES: FeoB-associated Cys-rich membrane protein [unclassified Desulfovibrio]RRD70203.1 FeoB-associated Cys-rich membrane protein [Desulfovibrio sp. OH1209_COT-279]RRD86725.1 FeoB-associated Cys-rich membrane protein [Desulfovibrio sp. OH1186_COT-070]
MDMQLILVIVCVGAAIAYMIRRARKAVKGGGCCGCSRENQECEGGGKPRS